VLPGLRVQGDVALVARQGEGLVSACGLLALGAWCLPRSNIMLCLCCAGHVPGVGK